MSEEMPVIEIAEELKHLSSDDIEELYRKYLDGERNTVLVKEYEININPNKLIRILPPQRLEDVLCSYCNIPMFKKRKSKSIYSWDLPPAECYKCNHKIFDEVNDYRQRFCECEACINVRRQEKVEAERQKRETIREIYKVEDKEPLAYSELSFFHKLVLLTLFRTQTEEEFEYVISLDNPLRSELLSPTEEMDLECLKELFNSGAIIIDPESKLESFVEKESFKSFYIDKARWIVNITVNGIERASLSEVYKEIYQELKNGIQAQWEEEIFKTLFRISREEVLQYVHVRADELQVNFTAENKTREVVNQLLQYFSVSELYYFVKKSIENAHIYYSKGYASNKKHAANTIPNKILSLGERAIDEGWNTYKYSRDSRAPRSYISQIFYDFLINDKDAGFHKAPGKYWEQELYPKYFCEGVTREESKICCTQCKSHDVTIQMREGNLEITCIECGCIELFIPNK